MESKLPFSSVDLSKVSEREAQLLILQYLGWIMEKVSGIDAKMETKADKAEFTSWEKRLAATDREIEHNKEIENKDYIELKNGLQLMKDTAHKELEDHEKANNSAFDKLFNFNSKAIGLGIGFSFAGGFIGALIMYIITR